MERICNGLIDWLQAGEGDDKQDIMTIMEEKQQELKEELIKYKRLVQELNSDKPDKEDDHKHAVHSKSSTRDDLESKKGTKRSAGDDFDTGSHRKRVKAAANSFKEFPVQLYVCDTTNDTFNLDKAITASLDLKVHFRTLKDAFSDAVTVVSTEECIDFVKTEHPVFGGTYDIMADRHRFRDWVTCVKALIPGWLEGETRTCRYFAGIPNKTEVITKATAAADRVPTSTKESQA